MRSHVEIETRSIIKQRHLLRILNYPGNAAVSTKIDAVQERRILFSKSRQCPVPGRGMLAPFPHLVEPPRITSIALNQIFAPDPEPAGNPDIDSIVFTERARCRAQRNLGAKQDRVVQLAFAI